MSFIELDVFVPESEQAFNIFSPEAEKILDVSFGDYRPLPPIWNKVDAFFYRIKSGKIYELRRGLEAVVIGDQITFPEIPGNDIFDFSNPDYWKQDELPEGIAGHTCPLTFLTGLQIAEPATDRTHSRLFFRDYEGDLRKFLPCIVTKEDLSLQEQQILADWLGWYATTFNGDYLVTDNDSAVI